MKAVGIKALKNQLSSYVRLAAQGEIVLVLDRDRVVAEIGPPGAHRAAHIADEQLAEAVRRGVVTPPIAPLAAPPGRAASVPLAQILRELDRDREER